MERATAALFQLHRDPELHREPVSEEKMPNGNVALSK